MLADDQPDRIQIAFDDHRLVANAGLSCPPRWPCTWAYHSWLTGISTWATRRSEPILATR